MTDRKKFMCVIVGSSNSSYYIPFLGRIKKWDISVRELSRRVFKRIKAVL